MTEDERFILRYEAQSRMMIFIPSSKVWLINPDSDATPQEVAEATGKMIRTLGQMRACPKCLGILKDSQILQRFYCVFCSEYYLKENTLAAVKIILDPECWADNCRSECTLEPVKGEYWVDGENCSKRCPYQYKESVRQIVSDAVRVSAEIEDRIGISPKTRRRIGKKYVQS